MKFYDPDKKLGKEEQIKDAMKKARQEELQSELKRAFKWMAFATESSQFGDFNCANYDMTIAIQHWIKCQNIRDRYISDEDNKQINWRFFTTKALAMAKKELKDKHNQKEEQ